MYPSPSRFALFAVSFEGKSVLSNGKSKNIRIGLNVIFPPSTADSREKSALGDIDGSRKLADKVVPSYNIPRRRSFDWRTSQWTTLVVEPLQSVIIGVYSFDKMVQDVPKVGYRPLTCQ
jgi:hypothetical protein